MPRLLAQRSHQNPPGGGRRSRLPRHLTDRGTTATSMSASRWPTSCRDEETEPRGPVPSIRRAKPIGRAIATLSSGAHVAIVDGIDRLTTRPFIAIVLTIHYRRLGDTRD